MGREVKRADEKRKLVQRAAPFRPYLSGLLLMRKAHALFDAWASFSFFIFFSPPPPPPPPPRRLSLPTTHPFLWWPRSFLFSPHRVKIKTGTRLCGHLIQLRRKVGRVQESLNISPENSVERDRGRVLAEERVEDIRIRSVLYSSFLRFKRQLNEINVWPALFAHFWERKEKEEKPEPVRGKRRNQESSCLCRKKRALGGCFVSILW